MQLGSGTSPVLCETSLLRSLVVRFLQGGKLSSQLLVAMVLVPCDIHLLAFLWLLEHTACSKAEKAWPTLRSWSHHLLSFHHPLVCGFSCAVCEQCIAVRGVFTLYWQDSRLVKVLLHWEDLYEDEYLEAK